MTAETDGRLTPREWVVADLVTEGLSNAEIGGRLGISPRTVQVHLGNAFTKMGFRNRTQLGQWVAHQYAAQAEASPRSSDVAFVQAMVAGWLERMPVEDRPAAVLRLVGYLTA